MKNKQVLWVTLTAIFIALLIVVQAVTAPFGPLVTGSLVNLILIISVMTSGLASGLTVAILSPIFATLFGIGSGLWPIVPFQMLGNAVLVLLWYVIGKRKFTNKHVVRIIALAAAAVCKFAVLYIGIVKLAVPMFVDLPAEKAAVISTMFSLPQLATAAIGGALAILILPVLEKALNRNL